MSAGILELPGRLSALVMSPEDLRIHKVFGVQACVDVKPKNPTKLHLSYGRQTPLSLYACIYIYIYTYI